MAFDRWKSCLDIYLLLENREIRDVIDTITAKAAPILSALITAPTGSSIRPDNFVLRTSAGRTSMLTGSVATPFPGERLIS